jgi:MEMO1 family protein
MRDQTTGMVKSARGVWTATTIMIGLAVLVVLVPGVWASAKRDLTDKVHDSVIAGSWYPGDETVLRQDVERYLAAVPDTDSGGRLVAIIAPHAGYRYSGQVAAHAYKLLRKEKFSTVVVIAPSHSALFPGVSVYDQGGMRTPLGVMPLDRELVTALERRDERIRYLPEAYSREHSLEIQLPFLQVVQPGIRLVPLVMGDQNWASCERLANSLSECIRGKSVLVVASTDLSHFYPYDRAKSLDQVVLDYVSALDSKGLHESIAASRCEACGAGPMVTAMLVARKLGATAGQVLSYANSGDVTGDRTRVVGYMAAALLAGPAAQQSTAVAGAQANAEKPEVSPAASAAAPPSVGTNLEVTAAEKKRLHQIAKQSIEARLRGDKPPKLDNLKGTLKEPRGAFVTLKKRGELRGCIGHIVGSKPLAETVAEMAEAAAFLDRRFSPVTAAEFPDLEIEISALTPLERISDVSVIRVGTHGIVLRQGSHSGLLLPQVATEYGWDRTTFLEQTCRKAGLPRDAWKDRDVEIYIFSAEVF